MIGLNISLVKTADYQWWRLCVFGGEAITKKSLMPVCPKHFKQYLLKGVVKSSIELLK